MWVLYDLNVEIIWRAASFRIKQTLTDLIWHTGGSISLKLKAIKQPKLR